MMKKGKTYIGTFGWHYQQTVTANWVYIRLHGPGGKYQGTYRLPTLQKWVKQCKHWNKEGRDVYCYFDNDQSGYAAANAAKMEQLME
ncbi:DUF72 domain-containing protein [Chitinophaga polysaccharea]|nr:DUF72 domain-containing protein [Chitinophaga polysaccharea]